MTITYNKGFFKDEKILAEVSVSRDDFQEAEVTDVKYNKDGWNKNVRVYVRAKMKPESWSQLCDFCKPLGYQTAKSFMGTSGKDGGELWRLFEVAVKYNGLRTEEQKKAKFEAELAKLHKKIEDLTVEGIIQSAIDHRNDGFRGTVESIRREQIERGTDNLFSTDVRAQIDTDLEKEVSFVEIQSELEEAKKMFEEAQARLDTAKIARDTARKEALIKELNEDTKADRGMICRMLEKVKSWDIQSKHMRFNTMRRAH